MNKQEALEILSINKNIIIANQKGNKTNREALEIAISALEKQISKKADRVGNKCPVCACYLASEPIGDHYCFNCGQAIDWSGEDE